MEHAGMFDVFYKKLHKKHPSPRPRAAAEDIFDVL